MIHRPPKPVTFDSDRYRKAIEAAVKSAVNHPLYIYWRSKLREPIRDIPEFNLDDVAELEH